MIILIFTWWRGEEGLANLMAGSLVHPLSMITSAIAMGVEISLTLEEEEEKEENHFLLHHPTI